MTIGSHDILGRFSLEGERLELATRGRNTLVLAGPGAGKTHLLVAHGCWLAQQRRGRVVLLTYSRKAAAEIKGRADSVLPLVERELVIAETIHAYALNLLRTHGHHIGLDGGIEPIDVKDVQAMADDIARREGLTPIPDFARRFERYQRIRGDMNATNIPALVRRVEQEMRSSARLDWDSCIRLATELLSCKSDVRSSVLHHDRHFLIDEAQDCDAGQLGLLEQLVGAPPGERHLFAVMDPDQSLYAFREANPELVRKWAARYVDGETELTENWRCSRRVQALAKHVLEKAWNESLEPGRAVLRVWPDRDAEATWLADEIAERLHRGIEPRRIGVFARRRSRLSVAEALLATRVQIRSDPREQWTPPEERILVHRRADRLKHNRAGTNKALVPVNILIDPISTAVHLDDG